MNTEHIRIIDEEVEALLAKGAIEEVSPSLGYYSKMFIVPKKDGKWHPIINLKCLNKTYMVPPCFQMDTPWDIVSNLHPGDWAALVDLKDPYFHVPVDCCFHRFGWRGRLYQYRVLPFGLCLAPWVFTLLTTSLKKWLRARGVRVIFYLDDILVLGRSEVECSANLKMALKLIQDIVFIVNWKKSHLEPSQHFLLLGLRWNMMQETVRIDNDKRLKLSYLPLPLDTFASPGSLHSGSAARAVEVPTSPAGPQPSLLVNG